MGRQLRQHRPRAAGRRNHSQPRLPGLRFAVALAAGVGLCVVTAPGRRQARGCVAPPHPFSLLPGRGAPLAGRRLSRGAARRRGCATCQSRVIRRATDRSEQIEVLYDGLCRVCLTNKALLESNDADGVIRFVNIAEEDYEADDHAGVEYEDAMNELHVILPDGTIVRGTDAVLRAYEAVGLGWAVGILGSPVLRAATDALYRLLSENRETISQWLPGGEEFRERIRSARFLQKGVAEGEGCNEEAEEEDEDCLVTEDKM